MTSDETRPDRDALAASHYSAGFTDGQHHADLLREAENGRFRKALADQTAARQIAGEAADRFRDVLSEALDLDENPGDDALVAAIRAHFGKVGPEPRRWRDFLTGALAQVDQIQAMPDPLAALDTPEEEK